MIISAIVEETLLACLLNDGRLDRVAATLHARTERRPSPLDTSRAAALGGLSTVG